MNTIFWPETGKSGTWADIRLHTGTWYPAKMKLLFKSLFPTFYVNSVPSVTFIISMQQTLLKNYCIERLKPLLSASIWERSLLAPFPKRTLATCSIRHRANCLARYESLTSPDLHYDMAATLSLSPFGPAYSRLTKRL